MYRFLQDNPAAQAPPPFTVSTIVRTHSAWRYLWPFQSRKALVFVSVLYAAFIALTILVVWWVYGDFHFVPNVVIPGCIGGMYCGVYRVLPAKLTVTTRADARHVAEDLKRMLPTIGYMVADSTEGHIHYCNKIRDKYHGLMSWDEQDLHMRWSGQQIDLLGPVAALEQLERRLCKQLER